jgi:hypothetical protein
MAIQMVLLVPNVDIFIGQAMIPQGRPFTASGSSLDVDTRPNLDYLTALLDNGLITQYRRGKDEMLIPIERKRSNILPQQVGVQSIECLKVPY